MNANYDREGAAKDLEDLAAERKSSADSGFQLSHSTKENSWPHAYKVMTMNEEMALVFKGSKKKGNKSEATEVVAHVQGIIWRHDLPPFRKEVGSASRAKFLRQSVSLTGLGTPTFEASMQGILDVYALFSSHVARESMKSCENCHMYGDSTALELSNRYFSPVKKTATENCVAFNKDVDPYGILARLESPNHTHCESNVVEYYERFFKPSGSLRYREISPARFNVGDIVEAQFIFLLVPAERHLHRLQLVLQSLTLLNDSYSKAALMAHVAKSMWPSAGPALNVKRKKGYAEEEVAFTRRKFARMEIDDANDEHTTDDDNDPATDDQEEPRGATARRG